MAEFGLASKLLSTIASSEFRKAYQRVSVTHEIEKLRNSIHEIKAVLLDAEKKQESSTAVKDWIERVKDVLYDADDLFDEVATDYLLSQQISEGNSQIFKKVRLCSLECITRSSPARKVKSIRKRLLEISADINCFDFVISDKEKQANVRREDSQGSFVDPKAVFGREQDKKAILETLFDESNNDDLTPITAIVGIGGIGKSVLSQLIYNDEEVVMNFERRWWACISKTSDEKQVLGKIFQSIRGENYTDFTLSYLHSKIRESVNGTKFLLVLDDVWDDDRARWLHRMSLFHGGAKGSRIIVTTRSLSVARAVDASETRILKGVSDDASWELFKRVAFTPEQEIDPRLIYLGKEITKKCANVPLAIKSIGALLNTKATIQEWESFRDEKQQKEQYGDFTIVQALKLSYDDLPSRMKNCFAYCSLFPRDYEFVKKKLVYLWIAQGYVEPNHESQTIEEVGYSYFMYLLRLGLFQEATKDEYGKVVVYKMHDLVHDLAQRVAGEDIVLLTRSSNQFKNRARHIGVDCEKGNPGEILEPLGDNKRLRSLVLMNGDSRVLALDLQFTNLRFLRALSLSNLGIVNVPDSIGELKHLRYLDLSHNSFVCLPRPMMNLYHLLTLDIEGCYNLKQLPVDTFRKLINLRCLNNRGCYELKYMPPGIGELTCLQHLSSFKLGKTTQEVERSGLDALSGLKQLAGELFIDFETGIEDWNGDDSWKLPVSPKRLDIWEYPGRRIPCWADGMKNNLSYLHLGSCSKVRYLPPLRSLPQLRVLSLRGLRELEYIEEEEEIGELGAVYFFPSLEHIEFRDLPKLKGWSMEFEAHRVWRPSLSFALRSFALLSQLRIVNSPDLKSIPLSPFIRKLELCMTDSELVQQLLSIWFNSSSSLEDLSITDCQGPINFPEEVLASLRSFHIDRCNSLKDLHLLSPNLSTVLIRRCDELKSVEVGAHESLRFLKFEYCNRLKDLQMVPHVNLEELYISDCPELKLWESQGERLPLDWDSLPNLRSLFVDAIPPPEKLPACLGYRATLGQLQITAKPMKNQRKHRPDLDDAHRSFSRLTPSTGQEPYI